MGKGQNLALRDEKQRCPGTESAFKSLIRMKDQRSGKQRSQVRLPPVQKARSRGYREIVRRTAKTQGRPIKGN